MVRFEKLQVRNFLAIKEAEVDLMNQGLVMIEGVNKDDPSARSNGSGKSSIVDAVSWCLYGVTARGVASDDVVNLEAGKDTRVSLFIEVDGERYMIDRYRKHSKNKNRVRLAHYEGGGYADITLGTDKLTQRKIDDLIGSSPDVFNASIYMGQERTPDLPAMTDKALKAIVEEAMSLDKIDKALENVQDQIRNAKAGQQDARDKVKDAKVVIDRVHDKLLHLRNYHHDLLQESTTMRDEWTKEQAGLVAFLAETVTKYKRAADRAAAWTIIPADSLKASNHVDELIAKELATLTEDKQLEVDRISAELAVVVGRLRDCRKTINELAEGKGCNACGRDFDNAAEVAKHIEQERARANDLKGVYDEMFSRMTDLKEQIGIVRDKLKIKAEDLRTRMFQDWEAYRREREEAAMLGVQVTHAEMNLKVQEERFKRAFDAKIGQLRTVSTDIENAEIELDIVNKQLDTADRHLAESEQVLETLEKVAHILGRKGFRGEVLDRVTPYLNNRTTHYLDQLTNGNIQAEWMTLAQNSFGDYVESFHIEVKHKSGVNKFANLSGGEKRKVRLACALALQDLVASRAVKPIKLFVADEIDDAIDESGLELLMGLLEEKATEMGTVLIISHNDIGDCVRNKITVTKEHNVSTITGKVLA